MSFKFGSATNKVIVVPKIVVIGVGGAGCNAVNNMISSDLKGVYFIVANTDAQSLATSLCENRVQLGATITSGLGAGSSPEVGKRAAEESLHEIEDYIKDANMLFIAAGMGGGTGTGATPVIAKLAKEKGVLTVGVVTKPFHFEQSKRLDVAEDGIAELNRYCDTLIVISNQKLFGIANEDTTFAEAFKIADNVLVSGVKCITNLITNPGIVNLDFADIRFVMSGLGRAIMGEGESTGENRAIRAAEAAITNPLLEHSSIVGATSILINITSGPDITLFEVSDIMQRITKELGGDAISKFGSVIEPSMEGIVRVSIVATGIRTDEDIALNGARSTASAPSLQKEQFIQKAKEQPVINDETFIRKEYPQNSRFVKEEAFSRARHDGAVGYSDTELEDNVIFENFEDNEIVRDENYSFFIPKTAARIPRKTSTTLDSIKHNTNVTQHNGLFAKIFKKN